MCNFVKVLKALYPCGFTHVNSVTALQIKVRHADNTVSMRSLRCFERIASKLLTMSDK